MDIGKNFSDITEFTKQIIEKYNIPFPAILAEKHPYIIHNMYLLWGNQEFFDYTEKLILNDVTPDRLQRQGFTSDAFMEIVTLLNLHNELFPQYQKQIHNDPYGF